jgi:hypothetical protein
MSKYRSSKRVLNSWVKYPLERSSWRKYQTWECPWITIITPIRTHIPNTIPPLVTRTNNQMIRTSSMSRQRGQSSKERETLPASRLHCTSRRRDIWNTERNLNLKWDLLEDEWKRHRIDVRWLDKFHSSKHCLKSMYLMRTETLSACFENLSYFSFA